MANDRIYLQCKTCKKCKLLWKYYPFGGELDGGYLWPKAEELADFIGEHLHICHPAVRQMRPGIPTLEGDPGFELGCESDLTFNDSDLATSEEWRKNHEPR